MAQTIRKRVDVVAPFIKPINENSENSISFVEILNLLNGKKYTNPTGKQYEFHLQHTDKLNCLVGIVITTQDKDLAPKKNKFTDEISPIELDPATEGLAYANVFLYDVNLNVLIYEINRNGCFLNNIIDIYNEETISDDEKYNLEFLAVVRKAEYERFLNMYYIKEFELDIAEPRAVLQEFQDAEDSIAKALRTHLEAGLQANTDKVTLHYTAAGKRANPQGLTRSRIKRLVDAARQILRTPQRGNIDVLRVKGYLEDVENIKSIQPINLIADTFRTLYINLPTAIIHTNLQVDDRKQEIERVYEKIKSELQRIFQ